ncbi:single-stranded DNA-binding protein [Candidatus Kaiserbacteria bacterium RIFCSPHIGHO2_01_FULL_48_10]|uniref:Single-stranded DNA-binding protein n=1 Tax=Candidatus Kaiserbacteria bacterium RIFCSPHIGHO2_01_FULL_48_10 TaxID=1798476 RepID=A0A1F6C6D7_9BACT|nr:MAG: single-stranded DNA-binding protein [Candidatus Kaiserbacteria bacterium RIFCSPHIGHO2_01_FULL_48_10]
MYLNKVFVYGNLTRDPEMRALPSGAQVASFSIATNRVYKNKEGEKQEAVEFHNIVAFGRQAEVIGQYLKKGRPVFIEGRLQTRSWETDGKKNYRTEIVVESFQFGADGGRGSAGSSSSTSSASKGKRDDSEVESGGEEIKYPAEDISPEDIPF